MSFNSLSKKEDRTDQLKSGFITAVIWSVILFFLFWYKMIEKIPVEQELVTRMLINFGDNRNGNGTDEPAPQEGSLASETEAKALETTTALSDSKLESATKVVETKTEKKESQTEKIITGNNEKKGVKTSEKSDNKKDISEEKPSKNKIQNANSNTKTNTTKATANGNSNSKKGDGKGNNAIGNLIAGRGKNPGSQGDGSGNGNYGDPLGGDGNGDSKIGIDRKLVGFIPGTMGRGGAQPTHNCSASGTILIAYTVDKSGNVTAAKRSSGISDPCAVATTTAWVKKYVKAEKANAVSTGIYSISF